MNQSEDKMDEETRKLLESVRYQIVVLSPYLQDAPGLPFKTDMTELANTIRDHLVKYENKEVVG